MDAVPVIVLRDCYVKLQVSNIKMKEAGEDEKRPRQNCSVPPSFVCFSMHEERLSDITVLYLRMLSEFHDSVIKVVLLCPQVSK